MTDPFPGDFTQEQLQLAGLALPEGNVERQGGQQINPGSDSLDGRLRDRLAEDQAELGRDDAIPPVPPAVEVNVEEAAEHLSVLSVHEPPSPDANSVATMTYRTHLHIIPGFDIQNTVTKTMYLAQVDLPGGVTRASATLNDDLKGMRLSWTEPGRAYNADDVTAELATNPENGPIKPAVRNSFEDEMAATANNLTRVNNAVSNFKDFKFPEKSEEQLFNPYTRAFADVVYIRTLPGGRCIAFASVWQRRNTPIQQAIDRDDLSFNEQVQRATAAFPGLANVLLNPAHFNPGNQGGGGPPAVNQQQQQLVQQLQAQIQQLQQQHQQQQAQAAAQQAAGGANDALLQPLLQRVRDTETRLQQQQQLLQQQQQTQHQAQQELEAEAARRVAQAQAQAQARFEETSAEIRRQYQTALERQRGELEAKLTAALGTVSNRLTPETLSRLGPDGLNNLVTQALHQAEVTAGTRAGVPTTVGGPRVTTVTDGDTSSSSSARMSHDSNLF